MSTSATALALRQVRADLGAPLVSYAIGMPLADLLNPASTATPAHTERLRVLAQIDEHFDPTDNRRALRDWLFSCNRHLSALAPAHVLRSTGDGDHRYTTDAVLEAALAE
jgi:hypothetical protein